MPAAGEGFTPALCPICSPENQVDSTTDKHKANRNQEKGEHVEEITSIARVVFAARPMITSALVVPL